MERTVTLAANQIALLAWDVKDAVTMVALCISIVSLWLALRSARTAIRPVLVFEYSVTDGWAVRNVGSGPALNVVVAVWSRPDTWKEATRLPALAKDDRMVLSWWGHYNLDGLGAVYEDAIDRVYSSTCVDDLSRTSKGRCLPQWTHSDIERHWARIAGFQSPAAITRDGLPPSSPR